MHFEMLILYFKASQVENLVIGVDIWMHILNIPRNKWLP